MRSAADHSPLHLRCWYHGPQKARLATRYEKLTGKMAVELIGDSVSSVLEPCQVGVRTPQGCEAMVHTTRELFFHHHRVDPSRLAAAIDISNAFNAVDISAVLGPFALSFQPPPSGPVFVTATSGVQHGDPLGAAFCPFATHNAITATQRAADRAHRVDWTTTLFIWTMA